MSNTTEIRIPDSLLVSAMLAGCKAGLDMVCEIYKVARGQAAIDQLVEANTDRGFEYDAHNICIVDGIYGAFRDQYVAAYVAAATRRINKELEILRGLCAAFKDAGL
jgi:hypothetical protein